MGRIQKTVKHKQIEEAITAEGDSTLNKKIDELGKEEIEGGVLGGVQRKPRARIITGPAGLSSIKVHLPLSGIRFIFSKKIVDKNEKFSLKFSYFSHRLKTGAIYLFVFIIIIGIAIIIRRKFKVKA